MKYYVVILFEKYLMGWENTHVIKMYSEKIEPIGSI